MNSHNLKEYEHLFKCLCCGNMKWKIGIYVRLSKDDGKKVSLSIVNQIKLIARYLNQLFDYVVVEIYIDDGLTGTDFDRNDFIRMQEDVSNGIINCIIVKDLTRYARNIADGIKELDSFVLEHHIRFISLDIPQIDTLKDPTAISSPEVYQTLQEAENFARTTSIKVRNIKALKREDGEKNGGFPPYGFLPNPDGEHWLYDPVAGENIKKIFLWRAEGLSNREIARKLNAMGISNPTTYKQSIGLKYYNPHCKNNSGLWWPSTVKRILEDKNNIGCSVQGKSSSFDHKRHKQIPKKKDEYVVVPDCQEKVVSEEMFEKVEKIRLQRTRITKKTGKVHMFANLVCCSNCKLVMEKTSSKNNEYLVCRTYRELGKEYCNGKRSINMKVLEETVLKVIQSQISLIIDIKAIVEKINEQPQISNQSDRLDQLMRNIKKDIDKTEHIFDSTYIDWKNGDISKEQYQRIRTETEKKLEQLRANSRNLYTEQQKFCKGIKTNNEYFEKFLKYKNVEKLDRLMLIELIDKIYVNEDKSLKIEFNYNDQYMLILDYIKENGKEKEIEKVLKKK